MCLKVIVRWKVGISAIVLSSIGIASCFNFWIDLYIRVHKQLNN